MADTIPALLKQCLKELTEITCSSELQRYESEVSHRSWLDELGRLRIWAGNIGAHQTGQSSLEYRLRDASHLKNETIKILQRISQGLESLSDLLNEPEEELEDEPYEEALSSDESEEPDDPEDDMTYAQVLHQSLKNSINLLFQMSMEIRRPADHDRLLGTKIKDDIIASFELHSHRHVSEKFPGADSEIVGRLGAAMAQQRAVLKYREQHRKKLAHGLIEDSGFSEISETIATDLPVPCEEDELGFLETSSISALTQTSYAPSMLAGGESLSVPKPPPESADGNPFECPYCCLIITIKNMKDWARHIFRDLMPYVCLVPGCGTPSKLYDSRRQWFHHMLNNHSAASPATSHVEFVCPLCSGNFQPPNTFERHVGHHLEQLSLFILPRNYAEEEDSPGGSDAVGSSSSVIVASDDDSASEIIDEHESMPASPVDTPSVHAENSNLDGLGDVTPEPLHHETEPNPSSWPPNTVPGEKDESRDVDMNNAEFPSQEGTRLVVDSEEDLNQAAIETLGRLTAEKMTARADADKGKAEFPPQEEPSLVVDSADDSKQDAIERLRRLFVKEGALRADAETSKQDADKGKAEFPSQEEPSLVVDSEEDPKQIAVERLELLIAEERATRTDAEALKQDADKGKEKVMQDAAKGESNTYIKFTDAVGRRYLFPFALCATWQTMQRLIKTALLHIEVVGTAVAEGRYDLVGPNGDIILPQVWEQVIKPGWTVTMHMWPFPEKLPGHIKRTEGGPSNNSSRAFDPPPDHPQTNLTEHLDVEGVLKGQGSPMQDNSQTLASDSFNHGHGATPEDIATEKTGLDGPLYQNAESQVSSHNPQNQTRREFFKLDVKTHDNANHDVTHLDGKRFRCRYPRCPQKMVFTLRVAFQQHIALQHFPRYTFHCDLCDRSLRMTRRDKLVSHYKAAHLQAPNSDTIDRQRIDIPCPPRCWFCPRISPSWPEFYQCFMSHCVIEDESERTDVSQPNPASPQSRKHHVTDVPSRGSTRYSRSGLNSAEDIYVHPATMRQHIIAASRESFDDKLSDDSDVRNEETPAEPLISEHASNQDPVRLKPELNTGAAQNSRKQKHPQAHWQAIQDRIKELEEQTTRLNQVQAQHQAAEPASGSPSIQCKVPGCPSSDKIYQSLSSFQRHIESRHHPRETFASANWRGKKK